MKPEAACGANGRSVEVLGCHEVGGTRVMIKGTFSGMDSLSSSTAYLCAFCPTWLIDVSPTDGVGRHQ